MSLIHKLVPLQIWGVMDLWIYGCHGLWIYGSTQVTEGLVHHLNQRQALLDLHSSACSSVVVTCAAAAAEGREEDGEDCYEKWVSSLMDLLPEAPCSAGGVGKLRTAGAHVDELAPVYQQIDGGFPLT